MSTAKIYVQPKADTMCFDDTANGKDTLEQPVDAKLHGDRPDSTARARQDPKSSMIDGPFGGKHPS